MLLLIGWLATATAAPEMIPLQDADLLGRAAPAFDNATLDGKPFQLEAYRGKPVVLSFWASWCGPCRQELPALSQLAAQRDDVQILAVNVDREPKLAQRFLQQVRVDLPIVMDPQAATLGLYDVLSMPTMFLLDANLTVTWRKTGFSTENGLTELLAQLDGR